jgi:hypothetical protein
MVPVGDVAMARELIYTHPGDDTQPGLEITIEVIDAAPVVTSVRLASATGVRVTDLKSAAARLERLTEEICAVAAWVRNNAGGASKDWPVSADSQRAAMPSIQRARRRTRKATRKVSGDEVLSRVANAYRNGGDKPTDAVKRELNSSHRTAARYVSQARAAGLLPATTKGKVTR